MCTTDKGKTFKWHSIGEPIGALDKCGVVLHKQPVLTFSDVTEGRITNWYELQQGCRVCSGNQQEHNASSLLSVKVQEWHRPYWPWIRHQSSLSHTSSLIPLLLISAPRTCTFQNNSFEMYWLYAELVSDTHLLLTDIHPCLTHTHTRMRSLSWWWSFTMSQRGH